MQKIAAYHAKFAIQNGNKIVVLKPDMDDYYEDFEILTMLGKATGSNTMGELVDAISKGADMPPNVLTCVVEDGDEREQLRYDWNDLITLD